MGGWLAGSPVRQFPSTAVLLQWTPGSGVDPRCARSTRAIPDAGPRSSADRAPASGAGCAGSSPAGGADTAGGATAGGADEADLK
jgi:hypothetical protein